MQEEYFSDKEIGAKPAVKLEIGLTAWGGLVALFDGLVTNGAFGIDYPENCPDGRGPTGTDSYRLGLAIRSEIPQISWPLRADHTPPTLSILDMLEFGFAHVSEPTVASYHSFFGHHHLVFDREEGQRQFRIRTNRILARSKIAYEIDRTGSVTRLAPPVLNDLTRCTFQTGDAALDAMLESAKAKFLNTDPRVRREALEKLWDAWERLKTLENGSDKRASTQALLDKVSVEPEFRKLLDVEARCLTEVGNTFHIRHSETNQIELRTEDHVDYLFHRLFSLIWMLLRAR